MNNSRKLAALAGYALFPALLLSRASLADEPPTAAAPDRAVWQKHEYSFAFLGFTSTYSCDGLADKLKVLLIAAGARRDAKSQPGACASGFGRPDKFARADLTFYTLAPAGADAPAGGDVPAGSDAPAYAKRVDAAWRRVTFADRSPRELSTGDCELVEQFQNNVLPMFTTRNVDNHTTCVPHQISGSVISLRFESLAAAPGGPHAPKAPPSGT
jgi:hypothetical protein